MQARPVFKITEEPVPELGHEHPSSGRSSLEPPYVRGSSCRGGAAWSGLAGRICDHRVAVDQGLELGQHRARRNLPDLGRYAFLVAGQPCLKVILLIRQPAARLGRRPQAA